MSVILIDKPAQPPSPAEASLTSKLEAVRAQLRLISKDVRSSEGRLLDFESAETIQRALHHAGRQLESIQISAAVLQRAASR